MSVDSGHMDQPARLPVWATVRAAYATVFRNLGAFVALATVPIAIGLAAQILIVFVPAGLFTTLAENAGVGSYYALTIVTGFLTAFVPWAIFVVAWNRFVLLGKRDTDRPIECYFRTRGVKHYFGTRDGSLFGNEAFLAMFLPGLAIVSLVAVSLTLSPPASRVLPDSRTQLATFLIIFFLLNLGPFLTVPAHAVGHDTNVYGAWRQVKGVAWRFLAVLSLVALPYLFFFSQLETPGPYTMAGYLEEGRPFMMATYFLLIVADGFVVFTGTALAVAALCHSYRQVVGETARQLSPEEVTSTSKWITGFVLPMALAVILAFGVYGAAGAVDLPQKWQVILAAIAGLGLLIGQIHRLQPRKSDPD